MLMAFKASAKTEVLVIFYSVTKKNIIIIIIEDNVSTNISIHYGTANKYYWGIKKRIGVQLQCDKILYYKCLSS